MKFKLNVYWVKYQWEKEGNFEVNSVLLRDTNTYQFVKEFDVEVDIPQDFKPLDITRLNLQTKKEKLLRELSDVDKSIELLESI